MFARYWKNGKRYWKSQGILSVRKNSNHVITYYSHVIFNRLKLFKTDLLQCTADELNYSLCLFVKEVRKPNGDEYAPDSIYYLCLGMFWVVTIIFISMCLEVLFYTRRKKLLLLFIYSSHRFQVSNSICLKIHE